MNMQHLTAQKYIFAYIYSEYATFDPIKLIFAYIYIEYAKFEPTKIYCCLYLQ